MRGSGVLVRFGERAHHLVDGQGPFLVAPPEDPASLAAAIARFFEERWAPRLTAGIEAEREKYSWDRLYEALEELIG